MKKLVAVLLAGVMCVSLAACGSKKADDTADTTAAETTESTDAADADAAAHVLSAGPQGGQCKAVVFARFGSFQRAGRRAGTEPGTDHVGIDDFMCICNGRERMAADTWRTCYRK